MPSYEIDKQQARQFLLRHQRLLPGSLPAGKEGIRQYVRHVGCIQYDPLNIAGHNHELVLQARVSGFLPEMAYELLYQDRDLIDGWDKNMSIYSTEDWPYFRRYRDRAYRRYGGNELLLATAEQVRRELRLRGPLSSLDLEGKEKMDWAWAPARVSRAAMESMYFWGELAVHHRVNTRRYYDFSAKLLPESIIQAADPIPTEVEYQDWYVLRRIGSIGLLWNKSGDGWLGIADLKSKERTAAILRLLQRDLVREVRVEGLKQPLYIRTEDAAELEAVMGAQADTASESGCAAVLAPLDNLLWERELVAQLFGFTYRWEVYKPAAEREYGYYVLPLLYGDRFVARLEPVMNKKSGILTIAGWWWEPNEALDDGMAPLLSAALQSLARCTRATAVVFAPGIVRQNKLGKLDKALKQGPAGAPQ
ncbi:winged helix-turn-helix domain-containing protein [Paenibacillus tengchongensis]|uniref:winged helix-turn-helix domain-containing protein n=1 Tax=Paenibacillus tengchongensis TaxID=2608684 RepID=UPI00124C52EA|nr:crosslink repair DNA glycosylase YcaQ family protein [Paenibacillus tengchongensis]